MSLLSNMLSRFYLGRVKEIIKDREEEREQGATCTSGGGELKVRCSSI